jgi:cytochrome c biogenesis protein CcmG/thiol:disulfide interchange protein DsbE
MQAMPRRLPPVLCLLTVLAVACTGGGHAEPSPSGSPARNAASAALLPTTVDALPDMDPAGFTELLAQLKGTPVIVNVWAAWCVPCKAEAPELASAAAAHGGTIQFLGVDVLDNRDDARRFIATYGWSYPSVFDAAHAIPTSLGHGGQPVTLFYDASGALVGSVDGQISSDRLDQGIRDLLG